ncbi:unnamed protein product [Cladocopium goreaui]|uniref:Poly(ADP-ribose) polymerase pme-5 n=1 Tax=Cladocopium goreaui TaxID=2562237 RepID=A0A9P1GRA3_9DINO|nr:unnamed protein product [Cladocopium goreaui]
MARVCPHSRSLPSHQVSFAAIFAGILAGSEGEFVQLGEGTEPEEQFCQTFATALCGFKQNMPDAILERMARAYPEALFAHVNDVAGRDVPCQCAKHNQERQQLLERIMYEHVCESFDALEKDAQYTRLIRMALLFEKVRTLDESRLSRGKLSFVVTTLMQRKMESWSVPESPSDFSVEARRFAETNPRVNLGKNTGAKIAMKSVSDLGRLIKSDFWELLKLANHGEATEIPHFEEMLNREIQSRLKWVASSLTADANSDITRYGIFLFAGLIADIIAAKPTSEDGEEEASPGKGATILSAVVKNVACRHL